MASLQKNVASQHVKFCMVVASTGAADASASLSGSYVTKDGGTQASVGGTFTNLGNGQYDYAPTQAETNATDVGFLFLSSGDIPYHADFHTDAVDGNGNLNVNLVDIAGSTISTSSAQLGVNLVNVAGAAVSTSSAQLGVNLVNIAGSAISTSAAQIGVNVVNIGGQTAALDGNNLLKVDVEDINGSATAAQNVSKANQAIGRGTCTSGGSTTSIPTSAWSPGGSGVVSGQFVGRTIIFDADTATAALQGQATNITANTAGATPTFTVTALTTAPSSGDTFSVL